MHHTKLVFAPHEDDELLSCAGVLKQAVQEQDFACVCFVTNGEYEGDQFAAMRAEESLAALAALGIPQSQAVFLGYADTGMPYEKSFLYRLFADTENHTLPSCSGRTETWLPDGRQEYRFRKDGVHSPYTRDGVLGDITGLLRDLLPDEIYVTAPGDLHGDHAALGCFVSEALCALHPVYPSWNPKLYFYLAHTEDESAWPPRTGVCFTMPSDCDARGLHWQTRETRPLPEGFSADDKYALLSQYVSQKPKAYDGFLLSFAKSSELLFPAEPLRRYELPAALSGHKT